MGNTLDLSKSLYDICKSDAEVINIMKELGFNSITEPGMLNTVGRFMTISKGASIKNIPLDKIIETFRMKGYDIKE